MDDKRRNVVISITADVLRSIACLSAQGVLMQTFLASLGFSSDLIYINTTVISAASIMTTILGSKFADKGNIILRSAVIHLPIALFYLFYLPACLSQGGSLTVFVYITTISFLYTITTSLHGVCAYKLPYFILPVQGYGTVMSITGILSSLVSLGSGILISRLSTATPFNTLMFYACTLSFLLTVVSAWLTYKLKPLLHANQVNASKIGSTPKSISVKELFFTPIFLRLIPANFMRGLVGASTSVLAAIALDLGFDTTVATMLVSVQSAASLLSFAFFGISTRKIPTRFIILFASFSILVFPLVLLRNELLFYAAIFVTLFGRIIVDNSIPLLLRQVVPVNISGPYNAWRMIIYNAGYLLSTTVATVIPVEALIISGTVAQLFVGISYFKDKSILENLQPDRVQQ